MKRMIRAAALTVLACLCLCFCACGTGNGSAPAGMKELSGEMDSCTLYIPNDWTGDLSTGVVSAFNDVDNANVSLMIFAAETEEGRYSSVSDFVEDNRADLEKTYPDLAYTTEPTNLELDGVAALKMAYQATVSGQSYSFMQVSALYRGEVYIFTYTALPDCYEAHLDEVQQMLDNFRFKK